MRKAIRNERRQNQGQNQWRSCDIALTVIISRRKKKGNRYERHKEAETSRIMQYRIVFQRSAEQKYLTYQMEYLPSNTQNSWKL